MDTDANKGKGGMYHKRRQTHPFKLRDNAGRSSSSNSGTGNTSGVKNVGPSVMMGGGPGEPSAGWGPKR